MDFTEVMARDRRFSRDRRALAPCRAAATSRVWRRRGSIEYLPHEDQGHLTVQQPEVGHLAAGDEAARMARALGAEGLALHARDVRLHVWLERADADPVGCAVAGPGRD